MVAQDRAHRTGGHLLFAHKSMAYTRHFGAKLAQSAELMKRKESCLGTPWEGGSMSSDVLEVEQGMSVPSKLSTSSFKVYRLPRTRREVALCPLLPPSVSSIAFIGNYSKRVGFPRHAPL